MTINNLQVSTDALIVTWADASTTRVPSIWLRDNCPSGLHPDTHERLLDLLAVDDTPLLVSAQL